MIDEDKYSKVLSELRGVLSKFKPGQPIYDEIVGTRDEVFAMYRPIFCLDHVPSITKEEFSSFLYFENNHHWSGLNRRGLSATNNMPVLRQALTVLLDESRPIRERFTEAINMAYGLGKAIATGILLVAYPEKYGVWNNTSEAALRQLEIWPQFVKGDGTGIRYEKINDLLFRLSNDLGVDLWTLDALWWFILEPDRLPSPSPDSSVQFLERGDSFALERQLEAFLLENWSCTSLAEEWDIYGTSEDPEAGNQYPTDVGRIDILAQHKTDQRFLVIELKRGQSTDQTVGQALRYMGWVKQHLAQDGQSVEALIIAHKAEKAAQYAILSAPNIKLMTYEIEFRLSEAPSLT